MSEAATKWKKEKPIEGGSGGCLHCGYQHEKLPLSALIAVGMGCAQVTKDGQPIYDAMEVEDDKFWTAQKAENRARKDPDHDWRIHLVAPMSERHYQRQGKNLWLLYKKGKGFA